MYNFLGASHIAHTYNMKLIVLFESGPYLETQTKHLIVHQQHISHSPKNWFHYYYRGYEEESNAFIQAQLHDNYSEFMRNVTPLKLRFHAPIVEYGQGRVYEWTRDTFNQRDAAIDYNYFWHKYVTVRHHVQKKVNAFYQAKMDGHMMVGIHFRGTDKYASPEDSEDGPIHYEYSFCRTKLDVEIGLLQAKELSKQNPKQVKILLCSDEQPFIEYMKSIYPENMLLYTNAIRAQVNTSGLHINATDCTSSDRREQCVLFYSMRQKSIHLGMEDESSYQKGEDVLIDVLLLSKCNTFLKSRGNVSNFPGYINKSLKIIDLVDEYQR
jgi:hypothetical protein